MDPGVVLDTTVSELAFEAIFDFAGRSARGDRAQFEAALGEVADVEPEEWDRL